MNCLMSDGRFCQSCNMKKFLLLILVLLQTSCVTKALWGDKEYKERINQYLVGADGRYVVFVGDNYHYVFTDNSGALRAVVSIGRNVFAINKKETYLKLDSSNNITGHIALIGLASALSPEELQLMRMADAYPDRNGDISVRIDVHGRRYAAKYLGGQQAQKQPITQTITIYYRDSSVVKDVGKVAVTPIAIGVDAVLLIGKVVVKAFEL